MKKAILFLSVIIISMSCSKLTSETFNPPEWLQGTWESDEGVTTWEITEHNLIYSIDMVGSTTSIDYKKLYSLSDVTEESSGDTYSFTYKTSNIGISTSTTETFQKISSTEMKTGTGDMSINFTKQ